MILNKVNEDENRLNQQPIYFILIIKFFKCNKSFQEFLRPEFQMLSYSIRGKYLK